MRMLVTSFNNYFAQIGIIIALVLFSGNLVFAAEEASGAVSFLDKLIGWLDPNAALVGALAVGAEVVLRLFKTEKPRSIIRLVSAIVSKVSLLLSKIAALIDNIVPDRTK